MSLLVNNPDGSPTLVLAHGAGAPMDSHFMNHIAIGVAATGVRVVRFEFPYMAERRTGGKKRPPNAKDVLFQTWRDVFATETGPVFIGGKSMGGRIASMLADELRPAGLICLGYPFHPPGKPEKLRTEHLAALDVPTLILHGTRDPFGKPDEIASYELSTVVEVTYVDAGDHSFKPTKASGRTLEQNLDFAVDRIDEFISAHAPSTP